MLILLIAGGGILLEWIAQKRIEWAIQQNAITQLRGR